MFPAKCRTVAPVVLLHSRRQKQLGDDFFEGLIEAVSGLRNELRQNRTNLLTLRASPPAPALALVAPRRQKPRYRRRKGKQSAIPRRKCRKWRQKGEIPADPRQKSGIRRRDAECDVVSLQKLSRETANTSENVVSLPDNSRKTTLKV